MAGLLPAHPGSLVALVRSHRRRLRRPPTPPTPTPHCAHGTAQGPAAPPRRHIQDHFYSPSMLVSRYNNRLLDRLGMILGSSGDRTCGSCVRARGLHLTHTVSGRTLYYFCVHCFARALAFAHTRHCHVVHLISAPIGTGRPAERDPVRNGIRLVSDLPLPVSVWVCVIATSTMWPQCHAKCVPTQLAEQNGDTLHIAPFHAQHRSVCLLSHPRLGCKALLHLAIGCAR